ncbi:MAG: hypothetical protein QM784_08320 [Polyangiaceae bacterium]
MPLSLDCGGALPSPPTAHHRPDSYADVPYAPPAALAEMVPNQPATNAVWVNGDWAFRGRTYAWRRGGWYLSAPHTRYAPSQVVYLPEGRILFAPGTWYADDGSALQRPKPIVPAVTPPNEITPESQTGR